MNDMKSLCILAADQGWTVEHTRRHLRFSNGRNTVVTSSTPSDHRSVANTIAQLRRNGLAVPHKNQKRKDER